MTLLLCGSLARLSEACTDFVCMTDGMITSTRAGFGSDCVAAQSDLQSDTQAEAQGVCQSSGYDRICFNSVVTVTKACAWNEKHEAYKVAGYRTYGCGSFVDTPGICP